MSITIDFEFKCTICRFVAMIQPTFVPDLEQQESLFLKNYLCHSNL